MTEPAETTAARLPQRIDELDRQIAVAKAKLAPLKERTDAMNQQVVEVRKQLGELAERLTAFGAEVAAVQREIFDTDQVLDTVAAGLVDVRSETTNAVALEAAHQTLSSMFGEAFQVVSRFFDTAQRLGLVGKDIAEPRVIPPISPSPPTEEFQQEPFAVEELPIIEEQPVAEEVPVVEEPVAIEEPTVVEEPPVVEEPVNEAFLGATELADWQPPLETDELPLPPELPPLPNVSDTEDEDESDIKDVEDLLAGLSMPILTS